MGIRYVERRLAPELCYEAVAQAVHEYLEECREAGELLHPFGHLMFPITRAGFYPQGLHSVKHFIYRHEEMARAEAGRTGEEQRELRLPGEDELIEEIMRPYPTRRLRAYGHRACNQLRAYRLAEEQRAADATECNKMRHTGRKSPS